MINKRIYDKVLDLIRRHKTRDPIELAQALGIEIIPIKNAKHLLGIYNVMERNRFIFLSTEAGSFTSTIVAHELGHDQLHRDFCKNGAAFQENKLFVPTNRYELEANIFACHLLISDEDIRHGLNEKQDVMEMAADLGVDVNLLTLKLSELAQMGKLDASILNQVQRPKSDFLLSYEPIREYWGC